MSQGDYAALLDFNLKSEVKYPKSGYSWIRSSQRVGNSGTVFLLTIPMVQVQSG
jgi:hypothetical protein